MSITVPPSDMTMDDLSPRFQAAPLSGLGGLPGEDPVLSGRA